ncbi:MAG: hypothetical protein Kow0031_04040 [Anaerolineae bacterium]
MSDQEKNSDLINEGIDYEKNDLKVTWLAASAAVILLITLGAMFLIMALLGGLDTRSQALGPTPLPLVNSQPTPPAPRLQPNPIDGTTAEEQMVEMYEAEDKTLTTYGWVNQEGGVARIPIDDAIIILTPDDGEPPK